MNRPGDHAILIGIDKYASDSMFPSLQSPAKDMSRFKKWLMSSDGGGVEQSNIYQIPKPNTVVPKGVPTMQDFQDVFSELLEKPAVTRERLYLYFSGHGFSQRLENSQSTSLYAANASHYSRYNIAGTEYANWTKNTGTFKEIVLVMDCCRDAEVITTITPPPLPSLQDPDAAFGVKLFCIYGAPKGGKAQERPIKELGNDVSSLLTHIFIKALEHAPTDINGHINGYGIKKFIEDQWNDLCGDSPADPPAVFLPEVGDIIFRRSAPKPLKQIFQILNWADTSQLLIKDNNENPICTIKLQAPENQLEIVWQSQQSADSPVKTEGVNSTFSIPLNAGLYRAVLKTKGKQKSVLFQSGGENVRL
tara:strand:+ start:5833 stop:6921 length:1089 start_codon:yes stop_codon:yes gene_type:complete